MCLQYAQARRSCFCLFEKYNRSLSLKQKRETVVWTALDLFLQQFPKRIINTDKSSGKEVIEVRERPFPPCLNLQLKTCRNCVCVYVCAHGHAYRRVHVRRKKRVLTEVTLKHRRTGQNANLLSQSIPCVVCDDQD